MLRNLREPLYRVDDEALSFLQQCGMSAAAIERVSRIQWGVDLGEEEWQREVEQHVGFVKKCHRRYLQEAAAVAAYHAAVGYPVVRLLVVDDAPQFKLLTEELGLCWVHEGRHFKKLEPHFEQHRQMVDDFLTQYWEYYRELLAYRERPSQPEAERLSGAFDQLFSSVTGYTALDERIAQTQAKKAHLLMVLAHPEIPLHNNSAELAERERVRKRDVSFGPAKRDRRTVLGHLPNLVRHGEETGRELLRVHLRARQRWCVPVAGVDRFAKLSRFRLAPLGIPPRIIEKIQILDVGNPVIRDNGVVV